MASVLQRPRRPVEQMAYRRKQETRVEDTVKHNAAQYNILARAKWEKLLPPGAALYVLRLLISRSRPKEISEPSCAPDQGDTWEI